MSLARTKLYSEGITIEEMYELYKFHASKIAHEPRMIRVKEHHLSRLTDLAAKISEIEAAGKDMD